MIPHLEVLRKLGALTSKVECLGLIDDCSSCALNHPDEGCLCILISQTLEHRGVDPEELVCLD